MPSPVPRESPAEPRRALVAKLADQLSRDTAPRLQLLAIMLMAGGAAFLSSGLLLWSPAEAFDSMALRYPAAALCGYGVFVALIRVWIALHRPADGPHSEFDPVDLLDGADLIPSSRGRSGEWSSRSDLSSSRPRSSWGIDLDLDDGVWLVVAGLCAAAGLAAIAYVVYMAPVLLAEVALDAAIVSVLYRRLKRDEQGYWLTTVLRHTWAPALVLVVFACLTGVALQQVAPEAQSIGPVFQSLAGTTAR